MVRLAARPKVVEAFKTGELDQRLKAGLFGTGPMWFYRVGADLSPSVLIRAG